jgi:hypothetical protein
VIGTGWWENTGQVWTDASKKSVGNQWGGPPVLVEAVPFQLILPVSTNYVKAWVLGPTGQRAGSLMVSGNSSSSTITMTNTGTLWYEVEVSRWMASFDLWRARYFSAEELADPAVTGAGATPERDGVPNLAKYYFGLPGNVAAGPEMLPQGAAMTVGGECFAVLTYGRDKLVRDVVATGEVSNDLLTWSSETGFLETVQDLGERERVTLRDALPLTQNRFLRLRLQKL